LWFNKAMPSRPQDPIEAFWEDLLSRRKPRILRAFQGLESSARREVLRHLQRMASEEGWHPEQAASARAALKVIADAGFGAIAPGADAGVGQ
jgi:hypothetical protein